MRNNPYSHVLLNWIQSFFCRWWWLWSELSHKCIMWRWLAQSLPNSLLRRPPPPPHQILESQLIRSGHFAKQMCRSSYSRRCWRHTNGQKWVSSILDKLRKGIFMNNASMSFYGLFRMRYYYIWRSSDLFLPFVGVFWIVTDRWNLLWTLIFPALWPCIWATDQMNFTFQCFKDTTSPFSFCNDGFADADIIKTMLLNREKSMKCRQSLKHCWFFPKGEYPLDTTNPP